jgi:Arc/MetJ-type ribon-helix-helix transcriptional regulator
MEKTTLYLPSELQVRLKESAKRLRRSQAELVREALSEYLGKLEQPRPRSVGLGDEPELSGRESEAWLFRAWAQETRER